MSAQDLGSRAIIGQYFLTLEQSVGVPWVDPISNLFDSNQDSETYKFLGQVPQLQQWLGGRQAKGSRTSGFSILNQEYESTLEFLKKELRRDKTGQIRVRIAEQVERAMAHWAKLLSTLIIDGESNTCYDGQFFFDTDHDEGDSGTQSNDISITLSGLPIQTGPDLGEPDQPSPLQMMHCIMQGLEQIYGFVDDVNEPLNETAREFLIMCPTRLWGAASAAVGLMNLTAGESNILPALERLQGVRMTVVANPRLNSTWGLAGSPEQGQFAIFRTDATVRPFIRQEEVPIEVSALAEGSELEFKENKHQYGLFTSRNVGYGMWQGSCLVTLA